VRKDRRVTDTLERGSKRCCAPEKEPEEGVMPLVYIVLALIVVGMGLWLINTYVPMAGSIKTILNVVVVISVCVWVLKAAGLWSDVLNYRVPH
jgi:predicted membrane protein